MSNSLELTARISVFVFVVTTMLSMGFSLTLPQILEPFKSTRLVILALTANFVLVPSLAYLLIKVIPMAPSPAIGLLLLGTCSGAPMLPKLVEFARGNLALGVGLMTLLMTATIVYVPVVFPMLLPGVHVHPGSIAKPFFITMLPPLAMGLGLRAYRQELAVRLQPFFRRASNAALLVVITVVLAGKWSSVARMGNLTLVMTGTLLLVVSFGFGVALGGPGAESRKVLALGTSVRNMSAAFLVAVENFHQSDVLTALAVLALLALLLQIPAALALGRCVTRQNPNRMGD